MQSIKYGTRLKLWLLKNNCTVTDFAKQLGVTRNYLSIVVNNKRVPGKGLKLLIQVLTNGEVSNEKISDVVTCSSK